MLTWEIYNSSKLSCIEKRKKKNKNISPKSPTSEIKSSTRRWWWTLEGSCSSSLYCSPKRWILNSATCSVAGFADSSITVSISLLIWIFSRRTINVNVHSFSQEISTDNLWYARHCAKGNFWWWLFIYYLTLKLTGRFWGRLLLKLLCICAFLWIHSDCGHWFREREKFPQ